jgi:D-tyrosyl-tRNA(Tyr) deacylase
VREARVEVATEIIGAIGPGMLVYLGVGKQDTARQTEWLADKLANLRIFEDDSGKMGRSLLDVRGELLVVSQFTLYGDLRKGRRPSFEQAAAPEQAEALYLQTCEALRARGLRVATGRFRAMMQVHAVVDGPITLWIDHERS